MTNNITIKEIKCKFAIGQCGLPGGDYCINPYIGCEHDCAYCYSRFMKRFTGHKEDRGKFVDVKTNIAEILAKQIKSPKYKGKTIFIGTVTDPYQPLDKEYKLSRNVLKILLSYQNPVSILTKSNLVLRDIDIIKQFKNIDINFTINTLDEEWKKLIEPNSSTIKERFEAIEILTANKVTVNAMIGPYWPIFTDTEGLFQKFKNTGVNHVFTESFNTTGGNFTGVEKILNKNYPALLSAIQKTLLDKESFSKFYDDANKKVQHLSEKYSIPVTPYFAPGHAGKFK